MKVFKYTAPATGIEFEVHIHRQLDQEFFEGSWLVDGEVRHKKILTPVVMVQRILEEGNYIRAPDMGGRSPGSICENLNNQLSLF